MGFGQRHKYRPSAEHGGSLQVQATDTGDSWHVGNEGGRVQARRGASPAPEPGCVVSGSASGLYLFLWNRSDATRPRSRSPAIPASSMHGNPAFASSWD